MAMFSHSSRCLLNSIRISVWQGKEQNEEVGWDCGKAKPQKAKASSVPVFLEVDVVVRDSTCIMLPVATLTIMDSQLALQRF